MCVPVTSAKGINGADCVQSLTDSTEGPSSLFHVYFKLAILTEQREVSWAVPSCALLFQGRPSPGSLRSSYTTRPGYSLIPIFQSRVVAACVLDPAGCMSMYE